MPKSGGAEGSGALGAGHCLRVGQRFAAVTGQWRQNSRFRRPGRPRRDEKGLSIAARSRRASHGAVRWLGGLCRTLPLLRPTLDPECRRRISCVARGDGTDICRSGAVRGDGRACGGDGERTADSPRSWRSAPANRCCMLSSGRTGHPSIRAHGGRQTKARRFADDAQDFPDSPRCGGRRSTDA